MMRGAPFGVKGHANRATMPPRCLHDARAASSRLPTRGEQSIAEVFGRRLDRRMNHHVICAQFAVKRHTQL
jgi:hypothetical protein